MCESIQKNRRTLLNQAAAPQGQQRTTPVAISSVASLAHELANLLDGASRYLSLTRRQWATIEQEGQWPTSDTMWQQMSEQLATADRAMTDMKQLLHHAQREKLWQLDGQTIGCGLLIEESLALIDLVIQQRRMKVIVTMAPSVRDLLLPRLMKLVFLNGLKNAIEAMDDQGQLTISATQIETGLCLAIEDEGAGVPDDFLETLSSEPCRSETRTCHTNANKMDVAKWHADASQPAIKPSARTPWGLRDDRSKEAGRGWGLLLSQQWVDAMGGTLRLSHRRSERGARWEVVVSIGEEDR